MRRPDNAFTLVEVLVAIAVLSLLVLFVMRLFDSAVVLIASRNKRMDVEGQARPLLDRFVVDFGQMVKRSDVDYYFKSSANSQIKDPATDPTGNDQIAFYSMVPGYYPSAGSPSPISLISYRVNAQLNCERMAKGLAWSGVVSSDSPMVFLPLTIATCWPPATNSNPDSDFELVAPNIFRFEYFYLLKSGNFSDTPWDASAGHNSANGLQDVSAICVAIASIDPKSRMLLSDVQLRTLAIGMDDFVSSVEAEALPTQWQTVLNNTKDMPRLAIQGIKIYQRFFQLTSKPP